MGKRAQNPRVERFTLVLTERERQALAAMAVTAGMSMSELVREKLFRAAAEDHGLDRTPHGSTG